MSIIYATSPRTGKTYSVSVAGSSPTQAEDAEIRSYIDQVEGFGVAPTAAAPETSETGNLIDFGKGLASGFGRGFADIPGGIASLAAAGLSYIPGDQGEEEIEAFGQGITDAARSGIDYVLGPLDDNVMSKSGQAAGSLASFLVPFAGGAKVASLAGAGAKATRLTGSVSAGTMGVALGAQNQVDRTARVLEEGGEVDNRELSILMGGGIGATEALPVGKVFGAVANILKKVPKQVKKSAIKTITQRLKSAGVAGLQEGGQEVVAAVLQDLVEKNMYNPDLELSASAYSDDAIYGGGAGATFNFLLESIAGRRIKKVVKAREQLERDQQEEGAEVVGNVARAEASMAGPAGVDTPLLPAPRLQLTDQRVPEETATEEDVQQGTVGYLGAIDSVKQQAALQNRTDETQALGAAARQSQLGGLSIELSSLPSGLAQRISNSRLRAGSDIDQSAPTSLREIEAVLPDGPEKDRILKDLELREKPDIVQSKTVEEAEAEKKVTDNLSLARVAVETNRVTNKDGTISRPKLQRELKIGAVEAQSLIDKLARQGELNPVGRNKKDEVVYQPIQPEKTLEEAVPNEAEQRVQEFESTLAELRVQQAQEQRVLEDMKRRSTATQQEQLELEAQQRRVSDLNGRVDLQQNGLRNAQAAVGPKPKPQVQLRANEARSAVSEADQAVPTDNHRRRLNTIANSLRKYLAGIGLADVDLTTTNVIDVGVEIDPETGKEMPFLVEGEETKGVDGRRIITLAMEIYDPNLSDAELEQRLAGVLNHEIIHSMKALGLFTDAEYQSLVKAAESRKYTKRTGGRNIQRDYTFLDRAEFMYPDLDPEGQQEEAIAEMFRAYTDGRLKIAGRPKGLFRRMVQFIKRIFGGYNEAGFKSVDELFSDIKSGKVGRRDRVAERAYQQFGGARASRALVLQGFTEPEKGNVARIKGAFKDVTLRVPELEKAANDLANNVIDAREYDRAVNLFKPAIPYPSVPQPATLEDLNRGLKESQIPMINQLNSSFDGLLTGLRLDIPAYTNNGVWVPTIHYGKRSKEKTEDGKSLANKVISHQSVGAVTNATFEAPYGAALNVAKGAAKGPFATIEGMYKHFSTEEAFALAERMINDPDVVQVGFDPTRHSYFYDRITMQPVIGADFVLQVGPLVLARKPRAGAKFIDEIGPAVAGDQTRKFSIVRLPNLPDNLIGPLAVVNDAKAQYMQSVGLPNRRQAEYVQVNTELARRIAVAFEESESNPDDPNVIAAYKAMADETLAQWQFVKDTGIKIEFIRNGKNPYPRGSKDVLADIRDNNHLWVFSTKDGFGTSEITPQDIAQNPMLADSGELIDGSPATVNDIFRIVHDYFGHGLEGSTFTARGEENAWQAHVRMYSPLAARAMTTETRGQNSWVNFNEVSGLSNRADPANTVYADQKLVILPSFVMEEGIAPDMEIKNEGQEFRESSEELDSRRDERADNARATGTGGRAGSSRFSRKTVSGGLARKVDAEPESGFVTLTHYSPIADLETIDPEKQRTNFRMRGEEQRRAALHKEMYPARSYYGMNVGEDIGYKKEYSVGDNVYQVNVPLESLYNFDLDPDGFREQAEPVADREVRAFSPETEVEQKAEYVATLTEKMIKDAGYTGYWVTDSGLGRVAAIFNPLSVEPSDGVKSTETKQIKMSRRRLPAGYADILPFMLEDEVELTESGMRHHVESRINNLVNIFNTLPSQEEMASVAVAGKAKRGWYKNSAQAILDIFGIYDGRRFTALLAATSPQTSVESNAINTLNIWANWNNAGRPKDRASILRIMGESVQGDKGEESILGAWINNSLRALSAPEGSEMQLQLSGPKVNSFMLNLVGAFDEVTNDAWMANYALVNQDIFKGRQVKGSEDRFGKIGEKGIGYIAFSAKVRRAADAASQITGDQWTPAEIQETVWSLSKALLETRKSRQGNMSGLTAKQMLQQGVITDKNVADVPDFATLFSNGLYGRILENAGYEKELSNIRSLSESIGSPVEARAVYGTEDLSINPSNFRDELDRFANRLETLARKTDDEIKPNIGNLTERETEQIGRVGEVIGTLPKYSRRRVTPPPEILGFGQQAEASITGIPVQNRFATVSAPVRFPDKNLQRFESLFGIIKEGDGNTPVILFAGEHNNETKGGSGISHILSRGHEQELIENSKFKNIESAIQQTFFAWHKQGFQDGPNVISQAGTMGGDRMRSVDGSFRSISKKDMDLIWLNPSHSSPPFKVVLNYGLVSEPAVKEEFGFTRDIPVYSITTAYPLLTAKQKSEIKQSRSVVRVPVNFNPPSTKSITALVDENEEAYQRLTYNNVSKILAPVARKFWDSNDNAEARLARTERFITKFQDAMLPVGKMVDDLKADGFTVTEGLDPYMREERSHGLIGFQLEQNTQNLFEPLRDTIGDIDISEAKISELTGGKVPKSYFLIDAIKVNGERMAIADAYMYALHAKERNEYVQNRHGRGLGSGMSETEANSIINWVDSLDLQNQQLLNGVRDYVKQIVASTNAARKDGGLMAEEYQYENYVPLRGNLDPESEMAEDGAGLARTYQRKQRDLYGGKRRQDPRIVAGRGTSYAEDIIGTVMMQNQTSIVDGERNKVGQTFLKMVQDDKVDTKDIAEVVTDVTDQIRDNVLGVKVNGQEDPVNILIFDDRIARAMKGAYGDGINRGGAVVRYMTKLNRYLSSINTTYNPEFMVTNFARDLETALVNIGQYDGKGLTKEILKGAMPAVAGIGKHIRARRGGEPYDQDNYWSQKYQEFMEDGGKNATNQIDTVKDQVNNIRDILGDISGNTMAGKFGLARTQFLGKGVRSILGMLDDANTAVENGVRVATYDALLKRGFSRARAAQAARNITVNFAKAGEERAIANALYLFYNASVQGSFALYNAMIRSPRVRKIWGGMILYGILQDQLLAALSGDEDEDGIPDYDELSDYTLEHNLMLNTFGLSDNKYIKIPLGYGINSAVNLGRALSRTQRGEYTVGQASNSIFGTLLESISPIGGVNDFDEVGDYAIIASPTVIEPVTSLLVNRDFDGSPIFKEGSQFGLQKPASQRHWTTTSTPSKIISQTINDLTGGSDVTPGAANVSPDVIDYIFGFYTGAAGKFVQRTLESPLNVVDALKGDYEGDIIREIPFLRKVGVNPSAFEDVGTFIENRDKVLYAGKELQYARQRGDVEGEAKVRQKFAKELSIYGQLKAMNNARNQLLRQRKQIENNPRIPDSQKEPLIKRYREKINLIVKKANALLRDAGVK